MYTKNNIYGWNISGQKYQSPSFIIYIFFFKMLFELTQVSNILLIKYHNSTVANVAKWFE